jgi:2-keto-4-pentenoate hydratase/2-oxohepta-3-ene-1,7-dioic acid hydratase in catechol pathway
VLFLKPPSSLKHFEQGITWNQMLGSCHYECELSLRIDQPLSCVSDPQQALNAIGAITLGLDLTLRDLQDKLKAKGHPWERAKAFDGACMLGDWVEVAEISAWDQVEYTLEINDELRQHGNTALLIFSIAQLLQDISHVFTLQPGDVVMTGTPAGVAALQANDQLRMTLKGKNQDFVWNTFVNA